MAEQKKKSLWGVGIVVLYGSFVVFILSAVIFSSMQDFSLVEDNYYHKSLSYQDKIDQTQNSEALSQKPIIRLSGDSLTLYIIFPDSLAQLGITGSAYFFRPSDKYADQTIPISFNDSNEMMIPTSRFLKGLWILKLSYESSQIKYYQEENLTL